MPRKPNATRPNANTGAATMMLPSESTDTAYEIAIRMTMTTPIQQALKLPATRPESTFSDAPPSREETTTSFTCFDSVDVKILMTSGMIAPASVPHVMMVESFHQSDVSPPRSGMRTAETMYVITTLIIE